jgi:hypothetical protein
VFDWALVGLFAEFECVVYIKIWYFFVMCLNVIGTRRIKERDEVFLYLLIRLVRDV